MWEIKSNTGKSTKYGNLWHLWVRFQSFSNSTSLVRERLKYYPRVSEISLSCTPPGVRFYISSNKWSKISITTTQKVWRYQKGKWEGKKGAIRRYKRVNKIRKYQMSDLKIPMEWSEDINRVSNGTKDVIKWYQKGNQKIPKA